MTTESGMALAAKPVPQRLWWFLAGLFFSTLATLSMEILDTRLLSVLTWYHFAFFIVSVVMFGMSAGAVYVYLRQERFSEARAPEALARYGFLLALSIPLTHLVNLCLPLGMDLALTGVVAMLLSVAVLAIPFYFAGVVVTVALTRVPGKIGLAYGVDLVGAALGCLAVIPLLEWFNLSSAVFAAGGFAALGAFCFHRMAGIRRANRAFVLAALLFAAAVWNGTTHGGVRVAFAKGRMEPAGDIQYESWSSYSQVTVRKPKPGVPFFWGAGPGMQDYRATTMWMTIDGDAGTGVTQWDGDPNSLDWVRLDVTSLPYHLRSGGDVAVIGVGGGRDILAALQSNSRSITGIEINRTFVDLLQGPLRDFAGIANRDAVNLVHDEARSYLTRTPMRFDIVQMSLIDTWAATGAGALCLSENGLYTMEAWDVMLGTLKPTGILSVSRWYARDCAAEVNRLVVLGTAALLQSGVSAPADHLALLACGKAATLLLSPSPLTPEDLRTLSASAQQYGFEILVAPGHDSADPLLGRVVASHSLAALREATQDDVYDYTPPTDKRPYFFNMLKPAALFHTAFTGDVGPTRANLLATRTLLLLGAISALLAATLIYVPLRRLGLPQMSRALFTQSVAYFAIIGFGFMMVQIPYIQRFAVYLGHPTYSIAVVLFSMILFTGVGSLLSDRLPITLKPSVCYWVPIAVAAMLLVVLFILQPVIDVTVRRELWIRCLVVVAMTAPVSVGLGFCFPIGMRLISRISSDAAPWMWGVNGACSVVSSAIAMGISMWVGIHADLVIALALYGLLLIPMWSLIRGGTVLPVALKSSA